MSLQLLTAIDEICERFEDQQQTDHSVRLEEFVPASWSGEDRSQLIHQLLKIDLEYRARRGESSSRETLTTRFADLPQVVESAIRETSKIKPPISGEVFLQRLNDSGILSREDFQKISVAHGSNTSGFELARELVRRNVLTLFQADEISQNRGESLLIGSYVLLERLGAGGMGHVFKARHQRMDRIVALKLLPPELKQNPKVIQRFQREARAAAKLTHPNIVTAYDADEALGGLHFLAMEYVAGCDLAQLLITEPQLAVGRVLNFMLQAARGLAFAHSQGVIHRDIKPSNLLLDAAGTVKVLDLGLARIHEAEIQAVKDGLSQSGDVMGTVDYMAPEQALDSQAADARADIYGLGCTLYRLLTGKTLFDGESIVQKLLFHQSKPAPSLRAARPDASVEVEAMFQRMVAKRVEDRFQSMEDLIGVLEPLADRTPSPNKVKPSSATTVAVSGLADTGAPTFEETLLLSNRADVTRPNSRRLADGNESETTLPLLTQAAAPVGPRRRSLIVIGAGGLFVILFAVWIIIKDKDGKELTRVKVPDQGTAITQIIPDAPEPTSASSDKTAPTPDDPVSDFAQQVFLRGGVLQTRVAMTGIEFRHVKATTLDELPKEPFTIEQVTFDGKRAADQRDQLLQGLRWVGIPELIVNSDTLTDAGLSQLSDPPPVLSIRAPRLTDAGLAQLSRFDRTERISLSELPNVTGTGLARLNPYLKILAISLSPITPEGIAAICNNQQLRILSLLGVKLTPSHLQRFENYRCQELDFNECDLDDELLRHLPVLETLTTLTIQNSNVSGQGLAELKRMPNLKALVVDGNSRVTKQQLGPLAEQLPSVKLNINAQPGPERDQ